MLEVSNLKKYYKDIKGIEGLSFNLEAGKGLGIIGINGSGKTTTFRILLGLLNKDYGIITFKKKDIRDYPINLLGYLPEERSLYKDLTVFQQVMFLGRLKNLDDTTIDKRLNELLLELNIPKYKYSKINKLSKGNQQKVQLICTLIHDPQIIILDEPLSGLDIINVSLLKKIIEKLKNKGKYILLSSHQFEHIEEFCDDLIILKNGDVKYSGSINNLIVLSKYKYLTVDVEIGKDLVKHQEIVDFKVINKTMRLKFKKENLTEAILKEIINKYKPSNICMADASIEDIVKEENLI